MSSNGKRRFNVLMKKKRSAQTCSRCRMMRQSTWSKGKGGEGSEGSNALHGWVVFRKSRARWVGVHPAVWEARAHPSRCGNADNEQPDGTGGSYQRTVGSD